MKLFLVLAFLLVPAFAFGAVGFDNCSTSSTTSGTSITWSHTVTGTNTLLIVTMHGDSDADGETNAGVTYAGVGMTHLQDLLPGGSSGLEVYYKHLGTADGAAHDVVINTDHSNTYVGSACSFTGVDSSSPLGAAVTNLADPLDSGSVTIPANGLGYEVGVWGHNGDCTTPTAQDGGQTGQFGVCAAGGNNQIGMGSTRTATGNFTWDASNGAYTGSIALPINPVAASGVVRHRPILMQ